MKFSNKSSRSSNGKDGCHIGHSKDVLRLMTTTSMTSRKKLFMPNALLRTRMAEFSSGLGKLKAYHSQFLNCFRLSSSVLHSTTSLLRLSLLQANHAHLMLNVDSS